MALIARAFASEVTPASAGSDRGRLTARIGSEDIRVHIYGPHAGAQRGLLIVFSGYERKARRYMKRARRMARHLGLTVIAPDLDAERFPRARYQRAGVGRRSAGGRDETCMGLFVSRLVTWARTHVGQPEARCVLFGHSAGAQMLSRVMAYNPVPDIERIILANPSAYASPSLVEPAPYGFAVIADVRDRDEMVRAYLAQPITIYLGTEDTGSDLLDETPEARRQGVNRLERGLAVFELARLKAERRGWTCNWKLALASGVGHSSRGMLRSPAFSEAVGAGSWPDDT